MKYAYMALAVLMIGCGDGGHTDPTYTMSEYNEVGSITVRPSDGLFSQCDWANVYLDGNRISTFNDPTDSVRIELGEGSYTLLSTFHYNDSRRVNGSQDGPYNIVIGDWEWDQVCYVVFRGVEPPMYSDNGRILPWPTPLPVLEPETEDTAIFTVDIGAVDGIMEISIDGRFVSRINNTPAVWSAEVDIGNHMIYCARWNDTGLTEEYGPVTQVIGAGGFVWNIN